MVNQMNKVRKNLTRSLRAKKHGFKASRHLHPAGLVSLSNTTILTAIDSLNSQVSESLNVLPLEMTAAADAPSDPNALWREVRKVEKKEQAVRSGKLGKNNSIINPILLSKKKVRRMRTREKYNAQREAGIHSGAAMDVEMMDAPPAAAHPPPPPSHTTTTPPPANPSGAGTTLGAPR
ncbi:hypothetical protein PhCBS80983_g01265 [Powellomyces hirtus]|uniref:Uncharacterized protein n=1 Tax=Powellomyces hirtus TaxID=109895 RepID=A0A507EBD1_9FUNG|nr:hypothetical protein PhCBS80983_g01265 [Powellomyces hirtus]